MLNFLDLVEGIFINSYVRIRPKQKSKILYGASISQGQRPGERYSHTYYTIFIHKKITDFQSVIHTHLKFPISNNQFLSLREIWRSQTVQSRKAGLFNH